MSPPTTVDLHRYVRDVPDFPHPGILFKDITPMLADPAALATTIERLAANVRRDIGPVDLVIGAEARGFLLGPALARELDAGFVLARKPGKLPAATVTAEYALEYGSDVLELHADAVPAGARVLVHDDLLATGGTARALCSLVEQLGGSIAGCAFIIELGFLNGSAAIAEHPLVSLLRYTEDAADTDIVSPSQL
jgi:adenine phosphoribosyltransferase